MLTYLDDYQGSSEIVWSRDYHENNKLESLPPQVFQVTKVSVSIKGATLRTTDFAHFMAINATITKNLIAALEWYVENPDKTRAIYLESTTSKWKWRYAISEIIVGNAVWTKEGTSFLYLLDGETLETNHHQQNPFLSSGASIRPHVMEPTPKDQSSRGATKKGS